MSTGRVNGGRVCGGSVSDELDARATAAGVVLCGGRSSRMGRPKALLPWRGRPMICHQIAMLREVVDEVVVVTSQELELPPLDALVVTDREPDLGPLGGIREGLYAVEAELVFVTSTDTPFVTPDCIRGLLAFGKSAACRVGAHIQPLPAVYERRSASKADALLDEGRARPLFLLEASDFRCVENFELACDDAFVGCNTPDEYYAAVLRDGHADAGAGAVTVELFGSSRLICGRDRIEVRPGTLGDILGRLQPELSLVSNDEVASHILVSLNGRDFIADLRTPIGPGEHLLILEAAGER